jgi:hypothetical protein
MSGFPGPPCDQRRRPFHYVVQDGMLMTGIAGVDSFAGLPGRVRAQFGCHVGVCPCGGEGTTTGVWGRSGQIWRRPPPWGADAASGVMALARRGEGRGEPGVLCLTVGLSRATPVIRLGPDDLRRARSCYHDADQIPWCWVRGRGFGWTCHGQIRAETGTASWRSAAGLDEESERSKTCEIHQTVVSITAAKQP